MSNELEDWQLALLVEARRFDDPTLMEAEAAAQYRDNKDICDEADTHDNPTVVEAAQARKLDEAEALLEAAEGIKNWAIVNEEVREGELETLSDVKDFLSGQLKEQHGLRDSVVESMSASAMVDQFRDEESGEFEFETLSQQPETGGSPDDGNGASGDGDGDGVDSLNGVSTSDRTEARNKIETANRMADRTPKFAESLRAEAADILGVEPDSDVLSVEVL